MDYLELFLNCYEHEHKQKEVIVPQQIYFKPKRCKNCIKVRKEKGMCFICYNSVKAIKIECCNGKLCLKCWKKLEKNKKGCPYCRKPLLSLNEKLEKIINKMLD
jgi:hypothetical protein